MNSSLNYTQLDYFKKKEFGPVKLVILQPTPFCNLDCDYCYLPERSSKKILSLELIEPIFNKLFISGLIDKKFTVVWHAGEPLSAPISFYESAFNKINELKNKFGAKECEITHSIQTNATLLNQKWCELIKKYDVKIGVSLDGPDFIHDAHRKTRTGKGTHASTMRGISLLKSHNIEFHVITVLTQESLDFPEEIFNFYVENDIKVVGFNIEEIEGTHQSSSLQLEGSEQRFFAFMKRFYELTKNSDKLQEVREFEYTKKTIYSNSNITKGQFTPFSIISIDYDGNFTTFSPELLAMKSSNYGDFLLGNVRHHTFEHASNTDKFRKINQDIQAGVEKCKNTCQYFALCGGGAPSNKYFENGSFNSTETMYCKYHQKMITDIVLADIEASLQGAA